LAIVVCSACSQKLRVPDGRRGTVTCPHCSAEWFYPETIELSDVEFRCSASGARFNVVSARRSPLHKFVVQKISNAALTASNPAEVKPLASPSHQPALKAGATPLQVAGPKVGGWLARIVGRRTDVVPSMPLSAVPNNSAANIPAPIAKYNADEYNWSGFSCPYCSASSFVACSAVTSRVTGPLR
jgi:hypothetical protein